MVAGVLLGDLLDGLRITAQVVLAAALVLSIVIVIHESGHFLFAKLFGIRVDEFALGFGPKVLGRQRGETLYAIRAIPAGGFVRMAGMLGLEGEADAGERNFHRAGISKRVIVMVAGIMFNFIFAGICFAFVRTQPTDSRVSSFEAAYQAGIHDGDTIVSIGGRTVDRSSVSAVAADLHAATGDSRGAPMAVDYLDARGNAHHTTVTPELVLANGVAPSGDTTLPLGSLVVEGINGKPVTTGDPGTLLGSGQQVRVNGFVQSTEPRTTFHDVPVSGIHTGDGGALGSRFAAWRIGYTPGIEGEALPAALGHGITDVPSTIGGMASGIYHLVTTPSAGGITGPQGLSGPVGIAFASSESVRHGLPTFVEFLAVISVSVGFLNILPIPFLDGGRIAFVLLEAVRRKRMDPKREAMVYAASLVVMVGFALYITIGDINKIPDFIRAR
jgi:regulator of sigma E protease